MLLIFRRPYELYGVNAILNLPSSSSSNLNGYLFIIKRHEPNHEHDIMLKAHCLAL